MLKDAASCERNEESAYAELRERIIVALDMGADDAQRLAHRLQGHARWVKVGMTLYYAEGPSIVQDMHKLGMKVFLDLKLHDIPFQIKGAARSASLAGADLLSVHALGSAEMIAQAREGVEEAARDKEERTQLVAITVLTSMDQAALSSIGVTLSVAEEVSRLARLAYGAGADGIVCSPQEARGMRSLLGTQARIVTPGVRPQGSEVSDQKRIATPQAALEAGASQLVIGRPITQAPDPIAAFDAIAHDLYTHSCSTFH